MAYTAILEGGSPWGFRLRGGQDFEEDIQIAKLNPNSKAYNQGVKVGDHLDRINGAPTSGLKHNEALQLIRNANSKLELELRRSDRKKASIPTIWINGPSSNGHASDSDYYYSSCDEAPEFVRTNAITGYPSSGSGSGGHVSDGDNSGGSTSGSQSSVVHVVGPYKGPLAENMKNLANNANGPSSGHHQGQDGQQKTPKTAVWSPFGQKKIKTYKPVSFNLSGSIIGGSPTSPTPQQQPRPHHHQSPQPSFSQRPQPLGQQQQQQPTPQQNYSQQQQPPPQQQNYSQQQQQPPPQQHYSQQQQQQPPQQQNYSQQQQQPHHQQPPSQPSQSFNRTLSSPINTAYSSASASFGFPSAPQQQHPSGSYSSANSSNFQYPNSINNNNNNNNSGGGPGAPRSAPGGLYGQSNVKSSPSSSIPSYNNFNGSGNVIVSSAPASSYTSLTMSSKKEGINGGLREDDSAINNNTSSSTPSYKPLGTQNTAQQGPAGISSPVSAPWKPAEPVASPYQLADSTTTGKLGGALGESPAPLTVQTSPALWSPEKANKEFRSIKLDQNQLKSPEPANNKMSALSPEESFAWKPSGRSTAVSSSTLTITTTTSTAMLPTPSTTSYSSHNGSISHHQETTKSLPTYQSPTITLLQKSRELAKASENLKELLAGNNFNFGPETKTVRVAENEIPDDAVLVGTQETVDGNKTHMDSFYRLPGQQRETKSQKVVQKSKPHYEGIGPTDAKTGIPIVPRGSVDKKNHKDWYRQMYHSLHKQDRKDDETDKSPSDSEEVNSYKPTYVFPEEDTESELDLDERGSTMSLDRGAGGYGGYGKTSFTLPNARYREEKYKNQPRSIENYEPGYSSLAFREARVSPQPFSSETKDAPNTPENKHDQKQQSNDKADKKSDKSYLYNPPIEKPGQFSKYVYSDTEHDIRKKERPLSPVSDIENKEAYRRFQRGGDIPYEGLRFPVQSKKERSLSASDRHEAARQRQAMAGGRSPTWDRKRREEEISRRKEEMRRITLDQKRKRMQIEMRANEARRHNDFLTEFLKDKQDDKYWLKLAGIDDDGEKERPSQKSPIALNRYEDPPDAPALQRPKKKMTQFKGKAKALYTFKAQNPKELSFRRNDILLLVRQIDKNWFEGEHHGRMGIFPTNYVEVITSLDEARESAMLREGQARAVHTFTAHSNTELSFKKGDTVSLIRRIDNNWYEGRCGRRHGIFPVSYVQVVNEPDTPYSSYAPSLATGSPGQLSPVSTISNGPAPTIPSAPISPRSSIENFDFSQPFNYGPHMSAASTLQRGLGQSSGYQSDYGLDDKLRPSSALGGYSDGYDSMQPDRYNNLMNRPSSAVPFTDYYGKNTTRDSGFMSSDESRYSRQQPRQQEPISRSMSNSYEARIKQNASSNRVLDDISLLTEETKYPKYRALYNYKPQNPDELELREGDAVNVMEICDDDWYVGTSERTKEFGTFPGNYVKLL